MVPLLQPCRRTPSTRLPSLPWLMQKSPHLLKHLRLRKRLRHLQRRALLLLRLLLMMLPRTVGVLWALGLGMTAPVGRVQMGMQHHV